MLRAVIIDDESIGVNTLKLLIEKYTTGLTITGTATDPEEGIQLIEEERPQVVFLDISMPKMDGFEMLLQLKYRDFKVVFTTAYSEYAIQAIKNKAEDYLLKPIDISELKKCVHGLLGNSPAVPEKENKRLIELSVKDGIIFIRPEEIIRLEASGSYTVFYLDNKVRHVVSKNLKQCERLLEHKYFYRCHPSHIVNLHRVTKFLNHDGMYAQMSDGSMPEISRKNKSEFLERLKLI